jgi:hypothetical protein
MPWLGLEPTIPVFERVKAVYVLDRAAGHCDRLLITILEENQGSVQQVDKV